MTSGRRRLAGALGALAALALAVAIGTWLSGGFSFTAGGLRVSANNVWRPLGVAIVLAALALALGGTAPFARLVARLATDAGARRAAAVLALGVAVLSLMCQSWTASGADSFGYVSQAALWRHGVLEIPVPLATTAPWPDALQTFVPFGYARAGDGSAAIVPMTSPGVPLLMALAQTVAGHAGAFLITPIAAAVLVFVTFAIGREVRSPAAGLAAAWLVATSPAVLFMLMWPMSDIPAAALTAVALWLLVRRSTAAAAFAGLAASAGILTRPTYVVLAAALVAWLALEMWMTRGGPPGVRWSRALVFVLALVPGLALQAWLNTRWFGAPWASGYAEADTLISLHRITANAARYARWLAETSPIAYVGLVAMAMPRWSIWSSQDDRRVPWLFLCATAGAVSVYLAYLVFDAWWYLRFLLPAWPAIFVATGVAAAGLAGIGRIARTVAILAVVAAGLGGLAFARSDGTFSIGHVERRYATIARLVDRATEPNAVILTGEHAGTIRYYAGRETLRYAFLDRAWLDRAIDWLSAEGRHPYILVEDWEQPAFEAKFQAANREGRLSYSPVLAWQSQHARGWVYLYDPARKNAVTFSPGLEVELDQPRMALPSRFPAP